MRELVSSDGTTVQVKERDEDGLQAGMVWLLPTAVIIFIGKAYIEGIVKEIGKDHYILIKEGLQSLYNRFVSGNAPVVTVMSTAGKVKGTSEYSLLFSLLAEASDGLRFKLLIRSFATEAEYLATVESFIYFLEEFHAKRLPGDVLSELQSTRVVGRTILLAYDPNKGRVAAVDPTMDSAR